MNRKIIGKISSSLIKADASYIPFHKYNPLINYDWSTKNINGLRYLTDKGKSPKYDARLYFGQGVYFNGVDQCVGSKTFGELNVLVNPPEVTICAYISDVTSGVIWNTGFASGYAGVSLQVANGKISINSNSTENATLDTPYISGMVVCTLKNNVWSIYINGILKVSRLFTYTTTFTFSTSQVFTIGAYRASSQYCIGKIKDVSMFIRALTQPEITQSYEEPEAFYAMAQADVTCVLNMPMCETDDYVSNMKSYSKGIELLEQDTTLWLLSSGWSTDGVSLICNSSAYDIATIPLRFFYTINDIYYCKIEIFNYVSGTLQLQIGSNWVDLPKANGLYLLIFKATGTEFNLRSKGGFIGSVSTKSIKQLSGVHEITNYTTSVRDNAKNLQYGLQTCKFVRDGLGVIQSASDYLECDGVGYANTGWKPSADEDWSIELITENKQIYKSSFFGTTYGGGLHFFKITNGFWYVLIGGVSTYIISSTNDYLMFTLVFKQTHYDVYADGVLVINNKAVTLTSGSAFYLGKRGTDSFYSELIQRLFKVHNKALTQAEITANYQSYQQKGLLA